MIMSMTMGFMLFAFVGRMHENQDHRHYHIICIIIRRQTVSLYHNSSVWPDTGNSRSWDQTPADSYTNRRFNHPGTRKIA